MPNTQTAKKELRVAKRRQMRNKSIKSMTKTKIAKAEKLIFAGELEAAKTAVATAISALDKESEKGVVHRNNAARRKARLMKKLNQALATATAQPPAEAQK